MTELELFRKIRALMQEDSDFPNFGSALYEQGGLFNNPVMSMTIVDTQETFLITVRKGS